MSTGGRAVARRGGSVLGVAACLLLAACGAGGDSDLDERVAELQEENEALRAQLEALESAPTTEVAGTGDTVAPTTTSTPSTPSTPSTTTTVAPATTIGAPLVGTRDNPHPLGAPVPAGDWTFTVVAFEPNVDPLVAQLDSSNEPAGPGKVYARMRLDAVYAGRGVGDPGRLKISLVSPAGTIVGEADPCCEPLRDMLADQPETFPGSSVSGWIYYPIDGLDAFGGRFIAFDPEAEQPGLPDGIVFFAAN